MIIFVNVVLIWLIPFVSSQGFQLTPKVWSILQRSRLRFIALQESDIRRQIRDESRRKKEVDNIEKRTIEFEKEEQKEQHIKLIKQESKAKIRKPETDNREYAITNLENGIQVLAVSDSKATKAGYGVSVEVGSFTDPDDLPGLAHLCEHLLFLGTKKYPKENEYDSFMSQNDGKNNAYTDQERTVYFNEINEKALDKALDIFGHFFIDPLFGQEMVPRELEAVNSEHQKNIPNLGRRMWEAMRSRASGILSKFYTGNKESLQNGNEYTIKALKDLHARNYCASRLNLVIAANRSVDEIFALAKKYFGDVPTGDCGPRPNFAGQTEVKVGDYMEMDAKSSPPQLWAMFPMDPTIADYKGQPAALLDYILDYAGPHALKKKLTEEGLVNDVSMWFDESSAKTIIYIIFGLSDDGLRNKDKVINEMLNYFDVIRKSSSSKKSDVLDSLAKMSDLSFKYMEQPDSIMDEISSWATSMPLYKPEDLLSAYSGVITGKNHELSDLHDRVLDALQGDNMNILLAKKGSVRRDWFNKWYGIELSVDPIPKEWLNIKEEDPADPMYLLPPKLKYVPEKLILKDTTPEIRELKHEGQVELWLRGSELPRKIPRAQFRIRLGVEQKQSQNATQRLLRRLHVAWMADALQQAAADLGRCGMSITVIDTSDGYDVSIGGYDEFVEKVATITFSSFFDKKDDDVYKRALDTVSMSVKDMTSPMPVQIALDLVDARTTTFGYSKQDLIDALPNINKEIFDDYIRTLAVTGLRVQVLANGNVDEKQANEVASIILGSLNAPLHSGSILPKALKFNEKVTLHMPNPVPGDHNAATGIFYQFGPTCLLDRVELILLGMILGKDAYQILRTEKQLGYVVYGGVSPHRNILEMRILVQGQKKTPDEVEIEIENALQTIEKSIYALEDNPKEFQQWKDSTESYLIKSDQNLTTETERSWQQIWQGTKCFRKKEMSLKALEMLTFNDIKHAWDTMRNSAPIVVKLGPNEPNNSKLKNGIEWKEEAVCVIKREEKEVKENKNETESIEKKSETSEEKDATESKEKKKNTKQLFLQKG